MIDCLENQAPRRQLKLHSSPAQIQQQQHQQPVAMAAVTYRCPIQKESSSSLMVVPTSGQQQASNSSPSNFQDRWDRNFDNSTLGSTSSNNNNNNNNELIGYYFGSISRETADWILRNHGNQLDGAYLLRSSGPDDDFVLSLMVVTTLANNSSISQPPAPPQQSANASNSISTSNSSTTTAANNSTLSQHIEVLHYKIVETEDSFVALHGQVGDEKFATIDELIDKAQGVATKPRWPISRQSLESQILPPTYWGLSVYQVCLAFFIKAKQWGFPLLPSLFQPPQQQQQHPISSSSFGCPSSTTQVQQQQQQQAGESQQLIGLHDPGAGSTVTTLSIETMRTLIYKSLHEFQPWFHGKISREEAERRIVEAGGRPGAASRDGKFLVRERDNYSYAMCICHRRATKHYRIDVLPTGELAIQDGRKFTSLMALVSHYTIMSDGLWCALTEPCARPIQPAPATTGGPAAPDSGAFFVPPPASQQQPLRSVQLYGSAGAQNLYCVAPPPPSPLKLDMQRLNMLAPPTIANNPSLADGGRNPPSSNQKSASNSSSSNGLVCAHPVATSVTALKAPIKEWLQSINQKWSQLMAAKQQQHQSLNSFLFGSQNPLNNHHCRRQQGRSRHHSHHSHHHHSHPHPHEHPSHGQRRPAPLNDGPPCGCAQQQQQHQQQQRNFEPANCQLRRNGAGHQKQPAATNNYQLCQEPPKLLNRGPIMGATVGAHQLAALQLLAPDQAALLNCLPQNSGFQLSGHHSFIGSPLFAVRNSSSSSSSNGIGLGIGNTNIGATRTQTGAASSNSSESNIVEADERLISPAQSISTNLNLNPSLELSQQQPPPPAYNQNDIYAGSQPSTAIVNDKHLLASSSSSSGTINQFNSSQLAHGMARYTQQQQQQQQHCLPAMVGRPVSGQIVCGQHAGPAYRYTNCQTEENSSFGGACAHRPAPPPAAAAAAAWAQTRAPANQLRPELCRGRAPVSSRAFDDSLLQLEPSQQLFGQAALSKFVQFQDGHCLRTHRDTRSIQMAYLSSQRTAAANQSQLGQQHSGRASNGGSLPFKAPAGRAHQMAGQQAPSSWNSKGNGPLATDEVDLMDCADVGGPDFRVDPKLIKSSSIETLCGADDGRNGHDYDEGLDEDETEAELESVLNNCKSNAELLQACFRLKQHSDSRSFAGEILQPTTNLVPKVDGSGSGGTGCQGPKGSSAFQCGQLINEGADIKSSGQALSAAAAAAKDNREKLDYLSKRHDLDELYTALFAELDASLKAQVDLKNKCLGFSNNCAAAPAGDVNGTPKTGEQPTNHESPHQANVGGRNATELIYEFDSLITSSHR